MAQIYTSGTAFTTATCVGAWIEYPFRDQGDSATKIYHHKMQVARDSYAPLDNNDVMTAAGDKPTRSPFADDSAAYFIGDTVPQSIDGGLFEFDRMFANVPADRTAANGLAEPNGLYAFEFPITARVSTSYTSTGAEAFSHNSSTAVSTIVCTLSVGDIANFNVGQTIQVENTASDFFVEYTYLGTTITEFTKILLRCIVTDITSLTLTCTYQWSPPSYYTYVDSGDDYNAVAATTYEPGIIKVRGRTETLQANSPSFIESKYVKSDDITAESSSLEQQFNVYSAATGDISATYTVFDGGTTVPARTDYADLVYTGGTIPAENETIIRWRGNIFERRLIRVVAK